MSQQPKIFISFDIEEFDLPEEYGGVISDDDKISIPALGTTRILDVLASKKCHATFFCTFYFAERQPDLIKRMVSEGHEIASHGMNHTTFHIDDLRESREKLEKMSGVPVKGFRMPRLGKANAEDVFKAGYSYESSINPTWLPGRYNHLAVSRRPFKEKCGLRQYSISVTPFLRFPLFWLSYKNLPLFLYKRLAGFSARRLGFFNLYLHPWEFNERCRESQWRIPSYVTRHAGIAYMKRLSNFIDYMSKNGNFCLMGNLQ